MQLIDIVKISLSNAVRGRMRALLTAISIAIGVSSVMLISTLGDSGKMVINRELDRLGISGVTIYSKDSTRAELTTDDAKKLRERVRGIEVAQPLVIEIGGYNANNGRGNVVLWGVDSKINQILDIEMLHGRMPNSADVKFGNNVVVIDETVAMSNFHRENAVGKEVVLSVSGTYEQFKIIGVMRSQKDGINKLVGGEIPEFTYLPYTTLNRMRSSTNISQIAIKCAANLNSEKISKDAVAVLERTNHLKDSYGSENMSGHVSKLKNIAGLVALLISAIAAISLCVAGLGIMNAMLASTTERRKEIGICMAIGAKRRDIAMCFLAESTLISAAGGIVGALVGLGISYLITAIFGMPNAFSLGKFLIAESVAIICGIVFAVIPALRASKLDPIVALRDE